MTPSQGGPGATGPAAGAGAGSESGPGGVERRRPPVAEAATAIGTDAGNPPAGRRSTDWRAESAGATAANRDSAPGALAAEEDAVLDEHGNWHTKDAEIDLSVYRWEDWVTLVVFWLLALDVFYQFFTRYVLSDSAAWTEEIARYLLIVVTFIGSAMGARRNTHIQVEFLYRYLPKAVGRLLSTVVDIVRVGVLGYATWLAIDLVPRMHNLQMTVIDWPMSYVYAFVAIGLALMTFRSLQVALTHWKQGWSVLERPETAF